MLKNGGGLASGAIQYGSLQWNMFPGRHDKIFHT